MLKVKVNFEKKNSHGTVQEKLSLMYVLLAGNDTVPNLVRRVGSKRST